MSKLAPPFMPPKRVAEAREIATGAKWFVNCPEMRCRAEGRCSGALRKFHDGGPRCYPSCLKLALSVVLDQESASAEDHEALRMLFDEDEAFWAGFDNPNVGDCPSAGLIDVLVVLAEPVPELGSARST